jgi:hypothetical protein
MSQEPKYHKSETAGAVVSSNRAIAKPDQIFVYYPISGLGMAIEKRDLLGLILR